MADITGNPPAPDEGAASLTRLWTEFGALWEITRTAQGYQATRRSRPAPPATVLVAETAPAMREMLRHGYDTRKLAGIMGDFSAGWHVERLDPGSAWIAISRSDPAQLVTAPGLDMLRDELSSGRWHAAGAGR
jgi:hypothetical protein